MMKALRKIKSEIICPPKVGEIVEGKILGQERNSLFLDLGVKGIGIIYGKEFQAAKDNLRNLKIGDSLLVKVINLETEEGYRELSVIEANQELAWEELKKIREKEEVFEIQIKGANKGGLVCQVKGIPAFLPASQLGPEHYPKVKGSEPAKIVSALQKFVGKNIKVKIFDIDLKKKRLILSEKTTSKEKVEEELKDYKVGDIVEGEISGVTNFGAFITFGKNLEGLISPAEISEKEIENPVYALKIGKKVKAKIIEIVNNRIYFSLKGF
ncbi:MAG: S1 RNA-binding domain-containing protein [Patescibacteria group bacterium]|nr:S1 RNA-binding domain-containing protein [Patescibacteria group bacterium]